NYIFETWNLAYSCNYGVLIQGGCAPNPGNTAQAALMNPATGALVLSGYARTNTAGEIHAGTIAPNGYYYVLASDSNINTTTSTATHGGHNQILCYSITGTTVNYLWTNNTNFSLDDFAVHMPISLGTNGIGAGCNYVYCTQGDTLDQRDLTNGNLIKRIKITNGVRTSPNITSGIAVDLLCGYVYVGSKGAV